MFLPSPAKVLRSDGSSIPNRVGKGALKEVLEVFNLYKDKRVRSSSILFATQRSRLTACFPIFFRSSSSSPLSSARTSISRGRASTSQLTSTCELDPFPPSSPLSLESSPPTPWDTTSTSVTSLFVLEPPSSSPSSFGPRWVSGSGLPSSRTSSLFPNPLSTGEFFASKAFPSRLASLTLTLSLLLSLSIRTSPEFGKAWVLVFFWTFVGQAIQNYVRTLSPPPSNETRAYSSSFFAVLLGHLSLCQGYTRNLAICWTLPFDGGSRTGSFPPFSYFRRRVSRRDQQPFSSPSQPQTIAWAVASKSYISSWAL